MNYGKEQKISKSIYSMQQSAILTCDVISRYQYKDSNRHRSHALANVPNLGTW